MTDSFITILATIAGSLITGLMTYYFSHKDAKGKDKREITNLQIHLENQNKTLLVSEKKIDGLNHEIKDLKEKVDQSNNKIDVLSGITAKYYKVKEKLETSRMVREYELPVILLGPRNVGKTSLLMQLYSPWIENDTEPTTRHRYSKLPIYDFTMEQMEMHFADPDVKVKVDVHLNLKIYDFPGELQVQQIIKDIIVEENSQLRSVTNKNLGLVLIFMFDAEEVALSIKDETIRYYNGDLFKSLRSFVSQDKVNIDKIIIAFNKFDKLKKLNPQISENDLLEKCVLTYSKLFSGLNSICHPEKVCEIATIFNREDMHINNKGASIIKGEAARKFVSSFVDLSKTGLFIEGQATNLSSKYWT